MADRVELRKLNNTTLQDLTADGSRIKSTARSYGHDAFMPVPTRQEGETVSQARGQSAPAPKKPSTPAGDRGRRLTFQPTGERVTVVREKIGRSYHGDWLHEVVTADGHKFMAMQKQLK